MQLSARMRCYLMGMHMACLLVIHVHDASFVGICIVEIFVICVPLGVCTTQLLGICARDVPLDGVYDSPLGGCMTQLRNVVMTI